MLQALMMQPLALPQQMQLFFSRQDPAQKFKLRSGQEMCSVCVQSNLNIVTVECLLLIVMLLAILDGLVGGMVEAVSGAVFTQCPDHYHYHTHHHYNTHHQYHTHHQCTVECSVPWPSAV